MNKRKKIDWLLVCSGLVFLSASIYRIFHYDKAVSEFQELGVSVNLIVPVIVLEMVLGLFFIFQKNVVHTSITAIAFLLLAIIIAVLNNFSGVIDNISELFILNANPTDLFLHIMYIVILLIIITRYRKI